MKLLNKIFLSFLTFFFFKPLVHYYYIIFFLFFLFISVMCNIMKCFNSLAMEHAFFSDDRIITHGRLIVGIFANSMGRKQVLKQKKHYIQNK